MDYDLRLIQKYDTAANWTSANPTLGVAILGVESDTGRMKVGDGVTAWTALPYLLAEADLAAAGDEQIGAGSRIVQINASDVPKLSKEPFVMMVACSDPTTAITTGTGKVTFRMPYAVTLTAVRASVTTAPTGSTLIIDINEAGTTILSTKLSIDASEKTSATAASAAVISDATLADDAEITVDFDQVGSTVAGAGVKVTLIGYRT
jgi:hypothetical protein